MVCLDYGSLIEESQWTHGGNLDVETKGETMEE